MSGVPFVRPVSSVDTVNTADLLYTKNAITILGGSTTSYCTDTDHISATVANSLCADPGNTQTTLLCADPGNTQTTPLCADPGNIQTTPLCADPENTQTTPLCADPENTQTTSLYTDPGNTQTNLNLANSTDTLDKYNNFLLRNNNQLSAPHKRNTLDEIHDAPVHGEQRRATKRQCVTLEHTSPGASEACRKQSLEDLATPANTDSRGNALSTSPSDALLHTRCSLWSSKYFDFVSCP